VIWVRFSVGVEAEIDLPDELHDPDSEPLRDPNETNGCQARAWHLAGPLDRIAPSAAGRGSARNRERLDAGGTPALRGRRRGSGLPRV